MEVRIGAAERAPLPEGRYYSDQLVGCRAETEEGAPLGEIVDTLDTAGPSLLVLRGPDGSEDLIPFVEALCVRVEPPAGEAAGRVVLDIPTASSGSTPRLPPMRVDILSLLPACSGRSSTTASSGGRGRPASCGSRRTRSPTGPRAASSGPTTLPTAAGPAWSCASSRSSRRWRRSADSTRRSPGGPAVAARPAARPRRWSPSSPANRGCCWSPGATRAWTSASPRSAAPEELSVGDYVLSGGEIPAMVVVDAVTRLLPAPSETPNPWSGSRSPPAPRARPVHPSPVSGGGRCSRFPVGEPRGGSPVPLGRVGRGDPEPEARPVLDVRGSASGGLETESRPKEKRHECE